MKPVLTKRDFVRRYQRGEFGNMSPTWTVDEWLDDDIDMHGSQLYHLRNQEAGGETFYNLTPQQLYGRIYGNGQHRDWRKQQRWENWYISEMAPTEKTKIQGEVQQSDKGLYFRYTCESLPMREALRTTQHHAYNLDAVALLRTYLDPASYDWLNHLIKEYPDHVIELSVYSEPWGTLHQNTVFWEVRKY